MVSEFILLNPRLSKSLKTSSLFIFTSTIKAFVVSSTFNAPFRKDSSVLSKSIFEKFGLNLLKIGIIKNLKNYNDARSFFQFYLCFIQFKGIRLHRFELNKIKWFLILKKQKQFHVSLNKF